MSKSLFLKGAIRLLNGGIDCDTDTMKLALLNRATMDQAKAISAATNATPIVVTSNSHGYANGDVIVIGGVLGNTAANGKFIVASQTTNTFALTAYPAGTNVAGSGAYTSGGYALNLSTVEFYGDVDAGVVGTPQTLASVTTTNAALDAADATFTAVSGAVVDIGVIYKDTGSAATSPLLHFEDDYTGLPVTPNGGDITYAFDSGVNKIFRLVI